MALVSGRPDAGWFNRWHIMDGYIERISNFSNLPGDLQMNDNRYDGVQGICFVIAVCSALFFDVNPILIGFIGSVSAAISISVYFYQRTFD